MGLNVSRMGGWLMQLSECEPAQILEEIFDLWKFGGVKQYLAMRSEDLNSTIMEGDESPTLRCWNEECPSEYGGQEDCWQTHQFSNHPNRPVRDG